MAAVLEAAPKVRSLFNELWTCGRCGREFPDATRCCAHEQQCGVMTRC
jgi:hypothetical protein